MQKLKVGLLTDNYPDSMPSGSPPGGIGTYTKLVAEELARIGHEAHVFTLSPVSRHQAKNINGVYVWECPAWGKRRDMTPSQALEFTYRHKNDVTMRDPYSLAIAVQQAVRSRKFDVLESPECGAYGRLVTGKQYTNRFAVRLHAPPWINLKGQTAGTAIDEIQRKLALDAPVITAPTRAARESIAAHWKCSLDRCIVVGNPVKIEHDIDDVQTDRQCSAVLFGRLCSQKGVDTLAGAIGKVRIFHPTFQTTFIGADLQMGPESDAINVYPHELASQCVKRITETTNGAGAYKFRDPMRHRELRNEVRQHAVCVLPSRWETFGMTFVEAMSWGVPCIVSDIAPFQELAQDGEHALFAETGNPEDFGEKISALLSDPNSAHAMAERAFEHSKTWTVEKIVPQLIRAWLN